MANADYGIGPAVGHYGRRITSTHTRVRIRVRSPFLIYPGASKRRAPVLAVKETTQ